MYKIVASDMDGTLLTPDHRVAPYTQSVLHRLHDQGKQFIFATGRHHLDVASFREKVGIPAYMITSNGARVHDTEDNLIFSHNVDPEIAKQLIEMAKHDKTLSIHIYRDSDWLVSEIDETLEKYHKESGFSCELFDMDNPPLENIAKIFFIRHDHDYLTQYEDRFNDAFGSKVSVAFSTPFCLEVMGAGVSKGAALHIVAEKLGCSLEDCIAFGDGMNDAEMLSMAGKGLVMGTAHPRVMEALPGIEVIGSSADESVAKYLESHLLEK
ncbi:Cof-type HAD-IIB family hydrolase [Parasalinivibrio latis]|uniref:Cof-type HAD-IIB family hydrolase n=1 Tax=Parasalinivibrio latis TaxID=2952610 RepID=UPI0030DE9BC8